MQKPEDELQIIATPAAGKPLESGDASKQAIEGLREFSRIAIALNQMGHRTNGSIDLFGDFMTHVDPAVVTHVLLGRASMIDVIGQPDVRKMLDIDVRSGYHDDQRGLLGAILPPYIIELLSEPRSRLNELQTLQDHESTRRFDTLEREYRAARGSLRFNGLLRWGVIDSSFVIPQWGEYGLTSIGVNFGIKFATALPHLRYSLVFKAASDGSGVTFKQELTLDPRTAMMTAGFDRWYQEVR